ncbi:MAG: gamma-glutamyl-gamma-aminobutyrate hydrolase family protein [Acidobacteriia bacterium]|nr:gamma-glutamyl-gamma-aminobutyrate hydrolase family protein [Terriglobia bacterium]
MKLLSLNVARPRLAVYNGTTINTGIFKQPVSGPVRLRTLNLDGDRQADLSVHGGPNKASMDKFAVNSLHGQGIDALAKPLTVEAKAPDGAIEAVSMKTAPAYLLGVQWHPEWKFAENAVSRAIFASFGEAMASHAQPKRR